MAEITESSYPGGELDLFAAAINWKAYVKDEVGKYLTGNVLEVGAGIGGTTAALYHGHARQWLCLEADPQLAKRLQGFLAQSRCTGVTRIIVGTLEAFVEQPYFDCILYIDVLEHIADDRAQVALAAKLVRPKGHIVILSPAHEWLFSEFDKRVGHLRRYNKTTLKSLVPPGWVEQKLAYLDCLGVFLSLGNVWALKQPLPTAPQLAFWDRVCVPISRVADRVVRRNFGKSVLAVWQKGI
jgi:SAM-dependent methyltransferase